MLISFAVSNYRSFDDEQVFSLVASRRTTDHPEHCHPIPNSEEALLPAAIFYGANGAGKSNLVKAIDHFRTWVLEGTRPKRSIDVSPFLLRQGSKEEPTRMQMKVLCQDRVVVYAFAATADRILEEQLYEQVGASEKRLYQRTLDDQGAPKIEFGQLMKEDKNAATKLGALSKAGPRSNQLFLTAIRENIDVSGQGMIIASLLDWIRDKLHIIKPETRHEQLVDWLADNIDYAQFVSDYVREAGTGISRLTLQIQEGEDRNLQQMMRAFGKEAVPRWRQSPDGDYKFEESSQKFLFRRVVAEHELSSGESIPFPLREESDGTQRLLHLLHAIFPPENRDSVFLIDEIDRSLHPLLARKFVENFMTCAPRERSQMVVTTHDTNLLDLDLFRRDEIWFTEKDALGATRIYSLSDFKVRKDLKVDSGYLSGRFGAIPFLGGIDRLLEECIPQQ